MPLENLTICATQVSDLKPLKDLKLTSLNCDSSRVTDLSPLTNLPLTTLMIHNTNVSDLSPVRGMRLRSLVMQNSKVFGLVAAPGDAADEAGTERIGGDRFCRPLADLPLKEIGCEFRGSARRRGSPRNQDAGDD